MSLLLIQYKLIDQLKSMMQADEAVLAESTTHLTNQTANGNRLEVTHDRFDRFDLI